MFVLDHWDGAIQFAVYKSGFCVTEGKLYISLECKALEADAFPDRYLFAVEGYPLSGPLKPQQFEIRSDPEDGSPNVHVYTTFHACEVEALVVITAVSDQWIDLELRVVTEDVNYYDERAQRTPFHGRRRLSPAVKKSMWLPT